MLAEAMLNHLSEFDKDVRAHSAGSAPRGSIDPFALEILANARVDTTGHRSKSWDEFAVGTHPGCAS
jgi:arsenate reductase